MDYEQDLAEERPAICPEGDGGNKQLVNQDEQAILNRTIRLMGATRTEGGSFH